MAAQRQVLELHQINPSLFRSYAWPKALQRGDHAGDGIVKRGFVVEVGLPESDEKLKVGVPTALVKSFTDGVGRVSLPGDGTRTVKIGTDHVRRFFAGGHQ